MTDNEIKLIELDKTVRENEIVRQINEKRRIDVERQRIEDLDRLIDGSLANIVGEVIDSPEINEKIEKEIGKMTELAERAIVFDTVADMKSSTHLKIDMTARTNGFHSIGDGGAAWYQIAAVGVPNDMDCILLGNGLYAKMIIEDKLNVIQLGLVDFSKSINRAISIADFVYVPDGTYFVNTDPINIRSGKYIKFGSNATINFSTNHCITSEGILASAKISGGRFISSNKHGTAIYLSMARDCEISNVFISDVDKGIVIDGRDKWAACNVIYNPYIFKFNTGIHLTADRGKQTNNTVVIGGYLLDIVKNSNATAFLLDASGDTNKCFGLAVEDCNIGFDIQSVASSTGMALFGCRSENMVSYHYRCNANSSKNLIIGCNFDQNSSKVSIGGRWNQNINFENLSGNWIKGTGSSNGIRYYDSGNNLCDLMFFEDADTFKIQPSGPNKKVAFGATDGSQVATTHMTVDKNGVVVNDRGIIVRSSTSGSSKYFKIIVNDSGTVSAEPVTLA